MRKKRIISCIIALTALMSMLNGCTTSEKNYVPPDEKEAYIYNADDITDDNVEEKLTKIEDNEYITAPEASAATVSNVNAEGDTQSSNHFWLWTTLIAIVSVAIGAILGITSSKKYSSGKDYTLR